MESKKEDPQVKAYEESEVPYFNPPYQNAYEKSKPNSKGFDQSGMK